MTIFGKAIGIAVLGVFIASSLIAQSGPTIKSASLLAKVVDQRPEQRIPGTMLDAPKGFAFLWIQVAVPKADSFPLKFELLRVGATDSQKTRYTVAGVCPYDIGPSITVMLEPVARGGSGVSDVTVSASSGNDEVDFDLSNSGPPEKRNATLTVKKASLVFSLFFVVPKRDGVFQIDGLGPAPLRTANLSAPKD